MSIRVERLSFSYGNNSILKHIDLTIPKGKFVGLIGPNGSGKSTLLKCVYRVLKPERGCIWLEDQALMAMPYKSSAQKMAVVSQHHHQAFDFTVEEMLLLGRTPYKKALERDNAQDYALVKAALEAVDMVAFRHRDFSKLSGGEQQRVILARALVQEPQYLLLDEPTNHMDIKHQLELLHLVKNSGITAIAALHDLNLALQYCDWVYVLSDGEIHASGDPRDVLTESLIEQVYGVQAKRIKVMDSEEDYIVYKKY